MIVFLLTCNALSPCVRPKQPDTTKSQTPVKFLHAVARSKMTVVGGTHVFAVETVEQGLYCIIFLQVFNSFLHVHIFQVLGEKLNTHFK